MNSDTVAKQLIRFQRNIFLNTFSAMAMAQEQVERTTNMMIDGAFWIPEEGVATLRDWGQAVKQGQAEWKRCVSDSFQVLEGMVAPAAADAGTE